MSDETPQLTAEQIAEIHGSDLYKIVKLVFSDESNDPDVDWFVYLTQFFASLLQTAALNSELIAKAVVTDLLGPIAGIRRQSEGGIILPDAQDVKP